MRLLITVLFSFIMFNCAAQKIYKVNYSSQADLKVYITDYESQADLKIYYVNYSSQVGWRNKQKSYLFKF